MPFALFAQNQANQDDFNFGVKVGIAIAMVIHQPKANPWGSTHHDSALKGPFKVQPCYDRVSSCIVTNFRTQMCMICDCFDENCSR